MSKNLRLISLMCFVLLLTGCAQPRYAKPIGEFQKSVDQSIGVIGGYYEDLNAYERRLYLEGAYLDPKIEVLLTGADGKPTPLAGKTFPAEAVKARVDALSLVSKYAKRLADLAGSEAPTQFPANAKVLGDNLESLAGTFSKLSGASDPSAAKYVGPISTLVGLIGQIYLEHRRDTALAKAIVEGDPIVTQILTLLEDDLVNVIGPLRLLGEKQLLAERVTYYNMNRATLSASERHATLDSINTTADTYSKLVVFNPSGLISEMSAAHRAMVKYAKSPRETANLEELAAALELFADRVDTAAGALQKVKSAK
jgi:hypothetical protein